MWIESNARGFGSVMDGPSQISSLAGMMNVDLMVNERGNIWVLHDQPLPVTLDWAEYNAARNTLRLIAQDGQVIEAGIYIPEDLQKTMRMAREIYVVSLSGQDIVDMYVMPLMVGR